MGRPAISGRILLIYDRARTGERSRCGPAALAYRRVAGRNRSCGQQAADDSGDRPPRVSSCPTLFAWDGTHYALVGDMLGAGVVGHWVAATRQRRAQYSAARPSIKIRSGLRFARKNGKLSFRFMEPLEESVYLDQAKLLAVDHPADVRCLSQRIFRQQSALSAVQSCFQQYERCASACRGLGRAWA